MARIVIVGGGSYTWGPLFVRDLAVAPELAGGTVVLHDVDAGALDLVYRLGQKLIRTGSLPFTVEKEPELDAALEGADAVILTITTGGLEAMRHDLEIPEQYGVYQTVGDTVGPGGLARALRNVPVVVELARRMERACPGAWLLNYTNPMTTLCRAVTRETGVPTAGLCHEYIGVRDKLAPLFGVSPAEIEVRLAGINHLAWIVDLWVRGEDALPRLRGMGEQGLADRWQVLGADEVMASMVDRGRIKARLLEVYGALPAAGDRHVAEFFPFFLTEAGGWGRRWGVERTPAGERAQWRAAAEGLVRAALGDGVDLAPFLQETSGEAASGIVAALSGAGAHHGPLNLPNTGQIANLPPGAVVETLGSVDAAGARALPAGDLPPGIQAVVARHVANQEMIVEAALNGDRRLALHALLNDPLVRDLDTAGPMLDEMLAANRRYLPRFFQE